MLRSSKRKLTVFTSTAMTGSCELKVRWYSKSILFCLFSFSFLQPCVLTQRSRCCRTHATTSNITAIISILIRGWQVECAFLQIQKAQPQNCWKSRRKRSKTILNGRWFTPKLAKHGIFGLQTRCRRKPSRMVGWRGWMRITTYCHTPTSLTTKTPWALLVCYCLRATTTSGSRPTVPVTPFT